MSQIGAKVSRPSLPTPAGLLARLRIRKKLAVIHTLFMLALAGIMLVILRPAVNRIVESAESHKSAGVLRALVDSLGPGVADLRSTDIAERIGGDRPDGISIRVGSAPLCELGPDLAELAVDRPAQALQGVVASVGGAALFLPSQIEPPGFYIAASVQIPEVRSAVARLNILALAALLAMYAIVVIAIEVLVLPKHVYEPIRRMLRADRAVQDGDAAHELIPDASIPSDELGEIMRSRNASVLALRRQEGALTEALDKLEVVAVDLKKKNHLLESARRNLADADRLASLGMMSAGIAHELNTPLAVVKGLAERVEKSTRGQAQPLDESESALLLRVVGRLERLSESLLDFARVRPPLSSPVNIASMVEEAITLVRLDRQASRFALQNLCPPDLILICDGDRIVQVLVNLIRNAVDAMNGSSRGTSIAIHALREERPDGAWVTLTVRDDGPGIDPDMLPRLFEPFVSSRLDARGTGLGLAVAEGIVREHGGMLIARNLPARAGAEFQILLPMQGASAEHQSTLSPSSTLAHPSPVLATEPANQSPLTQTDLKAVQP